VILEVLLSVATTCFASTVHDTYARMDTTALRALLADVTTREDSLLVRYRLYVLTKDRNMLRRLPEDVPDGTGRELAMLSALWAYRIPGSAPWNVVTFGRRSSSLLERALADVPDDPLVRLIEAQSLLFRPGIAGGDVRLAVRRLRELRPLAQRDRECGVPVLEVDAWLWYGLRKAEDPEAALLRGRLLAAGPPLLYRRFLGADALQASPFN
jgi:hypothetical protein